MINFTHTSYSISFLLYIFLFIFNELFISIRPKSCSYTRLNGIILYLAEHFFFYFLGRFFFSFQFASREVSAYLRTTYFPVVHQMKKKKMGNIFDMTTLSHIYNISSSHGARKMDVNNLAPSFLRRIEGGC